MLGTEGRELATQKYEIGSLYPLEVLRSELYPLFVGPNLELSVRGEDVPGRRQPDHSQRYSGSGTHTVRGCPDQTSLNSSQIYGERESENPKE